MWGLWMGNQLFLYRVHLTVGMHLQAVVAALLSLCTHDYMGQHH